MSILNKMMGIDFNEIPEVQADRKRFAELCDRREKELEKGRQRIICMQIINTIILGIVFVLMMIRFFSQIESGGTNIERVNKISESTVVEKGVPPELVKPGIYRIVITEE